MKHKPLCSIVIPIFNRAQLALETLGSVRHQTLTDFEAILVDDGSDEATLETIRHFIANDDRFRLISRRGEARGLPVVRNQGFAASRGQFILFLDADDLLNKDTLARRVEVLRLDSSLAFCVSQATVFSQVPGDRAEMSYPTIWKIDQTNDLPNFLSGFNHWQTAAALYRRQFLDDVGPYNAELFAYEDIEFHARVLIRKPKYIKLEQPDFHYRRNDSGGLTSGLLSRPDTIMYQKRCIEELSKIIRTEHEQTKPLRHALWNRVVVKSADARREGLGFVQAHSILKAFNPEGAIERVKYAEALICLAVWFRCFGKIPAMAYLSRRHFFKGYPRRSDQSCPC